MRVVNRSEVVDVPAAKKGAIGRTVVTVSGLRQAGSRGIGVLMGPGHFLKGLIPSQDILPDLIADSDEGEKVVVAAVEWVKYLDESFSSTLSSRLLQPRAFVMDS